jgi:hypothetical protein
MSEPNHVYTIGFPLRSASGGGGGGGGGGRRRRARDAARGAGQRLAEASTIAE